MLAAVGDAARDRAPDRLDVRRRPALRRRVRRRDRQPPSSAPTWPSRSATRRSIVLANHGVIVTGATIAEATLPGGVHRPHVPAGLRRRCCSAGPPSPIAPRHQEGDEGVAARARRRRLLGRRRAHCSPTSPTSWTVTEEISDGDRSTNCSTTPSFTTAKPRRHGHVPARARTRRTRQYTVISVDDHIVEPPDTFEGRVPAKFADRAPRVVEQRRRQPGVGLRRRRSSRTSASTPSSAARSSEYSFEPDPVRRDAPRRVGHPRAHRATWTSTASTRRCTSRRSCPGFAGQRLQLVTNDPELALATVRAWNDWHIEAWAGAVPGPHHPVPAPVAARSRGRAPRRSARTPSAGFKAVTFSEAPHMLGLPVAPLRPLGSAHARRARRPAPS